MVERDEREEKDEGDGHRRHSVISCCGDGMGVVKA